MNRLARWQSVNEHAGWVTKVTLRCPLTERNQETMQWFAKQVINVMPPPHCSVNVY
uniref:Uncharacterized protein n=1 Tax=Anguilla anguilla TaxID=7936 RepID=A0A0E9T7D6_ANGAN